MNVEARLVESDVDEESEVSSDDQSSTFEVRRSKCRNVFSFLTVEPIVALVSLAFGIQYVIGQVNINFVICHNFCFLILKTNLCHVFLSNL